MTLKSELEALVTYLAPLAGGGDSSPEAVQVAAAKWTLVVENLSAASKAVVVARKHAKAACDLHSTTLGVGAELDARGRRLATIEAGIRDLYSEVDGLGIRARMLRSQASAPPPEPSDLKERRAKLKSEKAKLDADTAVANSVAALVAQITRSVQLDDVSGRVHALIGEIESAQNSLVAPGDEGSAIAVGLDAALAELQVDVETALDADTPAPAQAESEPAKDEELPPATADDCLRSAEESLEAAQRPVETARKKFLEVKNLAGTDASFYNELDLLAELIFIRRRRIAQEIGRA